MRTPSLTPAEAEAILGSRGNLVVDKETRKTMLKWLTARGMPAASAAFIPYRLLQVIYNDTTDGEFSKALAKAQEAKEEDRDDQPVIVTPPPAQPAPEILSTETRPGRELQKLIEGIAAGVASRSIDADQVREIVQAELAAQPPHTVTTRVEITGVVQHTFDGDRPVHKALPECLQLVSQGVHVLCVGPAGCGKSTIAEQIAEAIGTRFFLIPAATGAHELLGWKDGAGLYHSTPFREAFEHGGVACFEELDSGHADVPLVLNAALANGHCAFPDSVIPVKRHSEFRAVANANTICLGADRVYVGRTQLDGATIDRFAFVQVDYDEDLERKIAGNDQWVARVQALRASAAREKARVIISPRASISGAKMIAAYQWTHAKCEDVFVWKGVDAALVARIKASA